MYYYYVLSSGVKISRVKSKVKNKRKAEVVTPHRNYLFLFLVPQEVKIPGVKTKIKNKLEWYVSVSSSTGKVSWKRTELN